MRARPLADDIQNALDFLFEAELALYVNTVAMSATSVTWHPMRPGSSFLLPHRETTIEQYLAWVTAGEYSAALRDGSLLQMTYDISEGEVVGHRLAYIPCPVDVDEELLQEGTPIADIVPLYLDAAEASVVLRSPVRFDYEPAAARLGHPAAHLSINSSTCRIACVAPVHPYRFIDFVYRQFYPVYRRAHESWFEPAGRRHLGGRVIAADDRAQFHVSWLLDAAA